MSGDLTPEELQAEIDSSQRIREVLTTTRQAIIDQGQTPGAWLTALIGEAVDTMLMLEKQAPTELQGKGIETLVTAIRAYAAEATK